MAGKILDLSNKNCESSGWDSDDYEEAKDNILDLSIDKLNLGPKKKLLVLSPSRLLVHRAHRANKATIPQNRMPDAINGGHLVFKRPFVEDFMKFCFERFEVGIWSSAKERNVDTVLYCAMGKLKDKLLFVWDQEECTDSGFKSLEKKDKPLFFKDLNKLWQKINTSNKYHFNESDTLLIDDNPYKALLNPPNTSIFPEAYNPEDVNDKVLKPNGELAKYLEGLAEAEDVQSYVKENAFGQPPVNSSHPDWGFYSKVLNAMKIKYQN
ncbi:hypothetical protein CICLE_v10013817mg [Citrus x clementina]|uniref:FCP1 domain-containing protein n=2 Tax=Citrus TaxID=2706 RepID=A0ACB8K3A6_CITSI|nr:hypothetical protein CICLE_v10013817mg [Citrus x clementina]KAH9738460.1 FCP1 domain-containing protein [Citrus sinensis]